MKTKIETVLNKYQQDRGMLVSILQDIQVEYNYLPAEAIREVSETLGIP